MPRHSLPRQLAPIFTACLVIVAAVYFLERLLCGTPIASLIEWVMWPAVAFWFVAGGTIFGGGFGPTADFLTIVAGSAAAWSIVIVIAAHAYTWLRRRFLVAR